MSNEKKRKREKKKDESLSAFLNYYVDTESTLKKFLFLSGLLRDSFD